MGYVACEFGELSSIMDAQRSFHVVSPVVFPPAPPLWPGVFLFVVCKVTHVHKFWAQLLI
jgi:hypothetical protein